MYTSHLFRGDQLQQEIGICQLYPPLITQIGLIDGNIFAGGSHL